jgi:hypothetical protein
MTLRDGGTTSITISRNALENDSYTIDYSLPWDGRPRFLFRGPPFRKDDLFRLEIGCETERELQRWLMQLANDKFGEITVFDFLGGRIKNPGTGDWFYAMNFLKILVTERCQQDATPNSGPVTRSGNSGVVDGPPSVS